MVGSISAQSGKNVALLLREFAVDIMKFVKFATQPQGHKHFLAATEHENRLLAYGIHNRMQHTSLMIQLNEATYEALNIVLLNMSAPLTRAQQ